MLAVVGYSCPPPPSPVDGGRAVRNDHPNNVHTNLNPSIPLRDIVFRMMGGDSSDQPEICFYDDAGSPRFPCINTTSHVSCTMQQLFGQNGSFMVCNTGISSAGTKKDSFSIGRFPNGDSSPSSQPSGGWPEIVAQTGHCTANSGELTCQQLPGTTLTTHENLLEVLPPKESQGTGGRIDSTYTEIPVKFTGCVWAKKGTKTQGDTTYDVFRCSDGTSLD